MKINTSGVLLIQVMIMVFTLSLLVGITASYFNYFDKIILLVELDKLYNFIILNSKIAALTQQDLIITFDIISGSYNIHNINKSILCNKVKFSFLEDVLGPPAEPTKKLTEAITFPKKRIILYKNGTISSGAIYLIDINKKHLCALTSSIAQIGSLRKYYYKNSWVNL